MAETTTTTWLPWRCVRTMCSATARMRSGSATDVPPYFWTIRATGPQATGGPRRRRDRSRRRHGPACALTLGGFLPQCPVRSWGEWSRCGVRVLTALALVAVLVCRGCVVRDSVGRGRRSAGAATAREAAPVVHGARQRPPGDVITRPGRDRRRARRGAGTSVGHDRSTPSASYLFRNVEAARGTGSTSSAVRMTERAGTDHRAESSQPTGARRRRCTRASSSRSTTSRATSGYGYLTTRDGTHAVGPGRAARSAGQGPVPGGRGVLGLRPVEPDAPASRSTSCSPPRSAWRGSA